MSSFHSYTLILSIVSKSRHQHRPRNLRPPFTKRVAPRIDFEAGRIVIERPREVEVED
jgi:hypothetical protein